MTEMATREYLKCDAPECDHFEMTPITIAVVDKPCPKCAANLCTKEDFINFQTFAAASRAAHEVFLRDHPGAPVKLVATNVHKGIVKQAAVGVDQVRIHSLFPNDPVRS
jgi:hypothetical protein